MQLDYALHNFWILLYDTEGQVKALEIDVIAGGKQESFFRAYDLADEHMIKHDANSWNVRYCVDKSSELSTILTDHLERIGYFVNSGTLLELVIEWRCGFICDPECYVACRYKITEERAKEMLTELENFSEWRD